MFKLIKPDLLEVTYINKIRYGCKEYKKIIVNIKNEKYIVEQYMNYFKYDIHFKGRKILLALSFKYGMNHREIFKKLEGSDDDYYIKDCYIDAGEGMQMLDDKLGAIMIYDYCIKNFSVEDAQEAYKQLALIHYKMGEYSISNKILRFLDKEFTDPLGSNKIVQCNKFDNNNYCILTGDYEVINTNSKQEREKWKKIKFY